MNSALGFAKFYELGKNTILKLFHTKSLDIHKKTTKSFQKKKKKKTSLRWGLKSKGVSILSDGSVEKIYHSKDPIERKRFQLEVDYLRHLESCPFVPKILSVDHKHCSFRMTYCGKPVRGTKENLLEIERLLRLLKTQWGLSRVENIDKERPQLRWLLNATEKDGKIYLIDFGSSEWVWLGHVRKPGATNISLVSC